MKPVYYTFLATLFITYNCNVEEPELPFEEPKNEQTIRDTIAMSQIKFNPGSYATLQNNFTQNDLQEVLKTPGLKGVQLRYTWKSMETAEGVYDFSKIESDLNVVSDAQKYLVVFFEDKSFKAWERYTPKYLWDEYTVPSNKSQNGEKGFIAKRWDNYVVERISALMAAMAERFDNEPWFEGVAFQETSIGLTDANIIEYDYTPEVYRDALIQMLIDAKGSFKNSQVFWYMNFLWGHNSYIRNIATAIAPHGVLMGGPDILPDNYSLNKHTYPIYEDFKDKLTLFCSIQNDSYHHIHATAGYDTKFWTLEEIYLWGKENLYIDYTFWNYVTWPFEQGAYTWEDAKPVILKYAELTTSGQTSAKEGKFKVYPNPGDGLFTVISNPSKATHEISIFNSSGRMVYQKQASGPMTKVDIRDLSAGIYLLKTDNWVKKVIKR